MTDGVLRTGRLTSYVALFASVGTLVCCALPALLVLLGFGAAMASAVSAVPLLADLSRHKGVVFGVAAILIAAGFVYVRVVSPALATRQGACPPEQADACEAAGRLSRVVLWVATAVYGVGFAIAYLLPLALSESKP
jgi:MFS family permease